MKCRGCEKDFAWLNVTRNGSKYHSEACAHYDILHRAANTPSTKKAGSISAVPGDTLPAASSEEQPSESEPSKTKKPVESTSDENTTKTPLKEPESQSVSEWRTDETLRAPEPSKLPANTVDSPGVPFDGSAASFGAAVSHSMSIVDDSMKSMLELINCVATNVKQRATQERAIIDPQQINAAANLGGQVAALMRVKVTTYKLAHKIMRNKK